MEKISRTKIVDVLKREDFGAMVNVKAGFVPAEVVNKLILSP